MLSDYEENNSQLVRNFEALQDRICHIAESEDLRRALRNSLPRLDGFEIRRKVERVEKGAATDEEEHEIVRHIGKALGDHA